MGVNIFPAGAAGGGNGVLPTELTLTAGTDIPPNSHIAIAEDGQAYPNYDRLFKNLRLDTLGETLDGAGIHSAPRSVQINATTVIHLYTWHDQGTGDSSLALRATTIDANGDLTPVGNQLIVYDEGLEGSNPPFIHFDMVQIPNETDKFALVYGGTGGSNGQVQIGTWSSPNFTLGARNVFAVNSGTNNDVRIVYMRTVTTTNTLLVYAINSTGPPFHIITNTTGTVVAGVIGATDPFPSNPTFGKVERLDDDNFVVTSVRSNVHSYSIFEINVGNTDIINKQLEVVWVTTGKNIPTSDTLALSLYSPSALEFIISGPLNIAGSLLDEGDFQVTAQGATHRIVAFQATDSTYATVNQGAAYDTPFQAVVSNTRAFILEIETGTFIAIVQGAIDVNLTTENNQIGYTVTIDFNTQTISQKHGSRVHELFEGFKGNIVADAHAHSPWLLTQLPHIQPITDHVFINDGSSGGTNQTNRTLQWCNEEVFTRGQSMLIGFYSGAGTVSKGADITFGLTVDGSTASTTSASNLIPGEILGTLRPFIEDKRALFETGRRRAITDSITVLNISEWGHN